MSSSIVPTIVLTSVGVTDHVGDVTTAVIRKGRIRRRTKTIRNKIRQMLDKVLCNREDSSLSSIFSLFIQSGDNDILSAPLETLLSTLGLVDDAKQLSKVALSKIGKESEIFDIIIDNDGTTRIQLKSNAPNPNDCTVYIDNLPANADIALIEQLASTYGTVVNVRLPMKKRRQCQIKENDKDKSKVTNNDRQSHCGFAFVRFTNKTAAQNIATAYKNNCLNLIDSKSTTDDIVTDDKTTTTTTESLSSRKRLATDRTEDETDVIIKRQKTDSSSLIDAPKVTRKRTIDTDHLITTSTIDDDDVKRIKIDNSISVKPPVKLLNDRKRQRVQQRRRRRQQRQLQQRTVVAQCNRDDIVTTIDKHRNRELKMQFRNVQVLPLILYQQLRKQYLNTQRTNMVVMKKQLKQSITTQLQSTISETVKRRRKSRRGRDKLIARAYKLRSSQVTTIVDKQQSE